GIIYLLAVEHQTLIHYLQKRYNTAGAQLFEGPNVFYTLSGILLDMLSDLSLGSVILMVDALDECDSGLDELLKLISRDSFRSPKVKWLVASRYRSDIERWLQADAFQQKINLELNSTHISHAVNAFIDAKISELAKRKLFDNKLQEKVRNHLLENSEETFLWVSLVCKRLEVVPLWKIKLQLAEVLGEFPPGLEQLYERMMNQIENGESAELFIQILSSITLTLRPIHLKELVTTAGLQEELLYDLQLVRELVDLCSSFLTLR